MFNTFGTYGHEIVNKKCDRQRNLQVTNLSTIQLDPWHDEFSEGAIYFQNQNFPHFSKPSTKTFSTMAKYQLTKLSLNKNFQNKPNFQVKNWYQNDNKKKEYYLQKRKNQKSNQKNQLRYMNKTISVHTIQGDRMFGHLSNNRREKTHSKQQKRQRTTINNPMYGQFCNGFNNEKNNALNRKKLYDKDQGTLQNLTQQQEEKMRLKLYTFQMNSGNTQKTRSIHEVRKRLKSTSQIMGKNQKERNNQKHLNQLDILAQNMAILSNQNGNLDYSNWLLLKQPKKVRIARQSYIPKKNEMQQTPRFKINRKKNLYVGFRKFFHPSFNQSNLKQRQYSTNKSIDRKDYINIQQIKQMGLIKKVSST